MTRRHRFSLFLVVTLLAAVSVPTTASAGYRDVYKECTDGTLESTFSATELQQALQRMGAYERDYTNCTDAIYVAQTGGKKKPSGGNGTNGGGSGSNPGAGAGAGGGGTGSDPGSGSSSGGATGGTADSGATGTTTANSSPVVAASDASPEESNDSVARAVHAATAGQTQDRALADVAVPASALDLGASGAALPLPLLLVLIAGGIAACAAGSTAAVQAVRRRLSR